MIIVTPQKATRKLTKTHNKRLILKTIYQQGPISRASVARITGLTRPTVSNTVVELIEEGLVIEVGQGPSEGGKPPILLSVLDDSRHLIAVDLLFGGSSLRGAVTDLRGRVVHRLSSPWRRRDGMLPLEPAFDLIDRLIALASRPLLGISIGTPGLMDPQRGLVREAVNLNWQDFPLRDLLAERYNLPVYVANSSQMAALGEYTFGPGGDSSNLIVLKVGWGIGVGIVLNGQLHYGDGSGAGEIGHVVVVENGKRCRCGLYGCLETVASSQAIIERAKMIASGDPGSRLHHFMDGADSLNIDIVLRAFEAGDEALHQAIAEVGYYLGIVTANLIGTLNVQRILITGNMTRFGQPLLESIRQEMKRRALPALVKETQVEMCSLGEDIIIQGAAALLLNHELGLV
jgi:glucokinase-like ROK family protein